MIHMERAMDRTQERIEFAVERVTAYFDAACTANFDCPVPHSSLAEIRAAIAALNAEHEASARDAARYRFLRDHQAEVDWSGPATWRVVGTDPSNPVAGVSGSTLDEAVDYAIAARAATREEGAAPLPRDEGDPLPQISFEYGGRDVWHTDCPQQRHAAPMKHLKGRLPIGDGVVLYEYECTVCSVRVFGGCDKAGRIVRRAATREEGTPR